MQPSHCDPCDRGPIRSRDGSHHNRVDTLGLIPIDKLDVSTRNQGRGWGYMATQPEWFQTVLGQLEIRFEEYTFVDLGSGKGRALLLADSLR